MSGSILRFELRLLCRDPRVRWMAALLAALLTLSFATALHETVTSTAEQERIAREERQRWLAQPAKNPHTAAHYGIWAIKAASPLRLLDPGVEPFVGAALKLEAHKRYETVFRPRQDGDPIQRAGTGHVAGLLQLLAPLAVILLGFTAFAVDRERGTLRLALGNGASPDRLLAARFAALLMIVAVVVIGPALLLSLLAWGLLPDAGWNVGARLVAWLLAYLGYATIFLLMSMTISLVAKSARTALTALLVAWALLCIAAPRLASAWIDNHAALPSYQATRAQIEAETIAYDSAENWARRRRETMRAYGMTREDDLPISLRGAQLVDSESHGWRVYDRLLGGFYDKVQRQDDLYGLAGFLSPAISVAVASAGIAGTDFRQHRAYLDDAESYRRKLVMRMNMELRDHPVAEGETYKGGQKLWADVDFFAYRPVPFAYILSSLATPVSALVAWLVVAVGAAVVAARRIRL